MNPLEALSLLTQAASIARLTKQEHVQLETAAKTLHDALKKEDKPKEETNAESG